MATLKELKGRIGSVSSSEKITGAMKMISSAKMHKAEGALRRLVPFRTQIETIIGNIIGADADFTSPLTVARPVNRMAVVILGSDDGLCGAYNINLAKFLREHIAGLRERFGMNLEIEIHAVGKKMRKACSKFADAHTVIAEAQGVDSKSDGMKVKDFTAGLQHRFIAKEIDRVDVLYMHYISAGRQRATADQLLPVDSEAFSSNGETPDAGRLYIFEPSAGDIFRSALPMYLLSTMQEIFCENRASEQAARVMAMQSANDNAKKLLDQLQLEYNKLRQQSITTELLDIVGGQVRE
ncbi:MAG: ATP synthase F1 subunit gamma [Muribaculaceae bacterium]|nr:ATP synthase F1 subunit gamma [Muribaculaceae bacterium]MDE6331001.1 ATP synthase F1 subunit gamma [Muribaculaceae bacterium]